MRKRDKWTEFELYSFQREFTSDEIWELGKDSIINKNGRLEGIYKIINKQSEKCYIGASQNIMSRMKGHISNLKLGKHSIFEMQQDYNKYGIISFRFIIILFCSHSELSKYEKEKLEEHKNRLYNVDELNGWYSGISKINRRSLDR
ncbi:MAG: GIY-YIG nuclease family protein [Epulopiscium sp.]|jgi:group I intron endonuclease|nr:GIY-YIG nuclease family protein [Candidatus Epulonipiscium sp.]